MAISAPFWRGKRVFVTGHTGFKGAWLCLWLQHLAAKVTGYSLPPPTTPNLFDIARVAETMASITGDVRDLDALKTALDNARPEIVIHMAAQSLVRYSYTHPVETYVTNVIGTVNLLECVRQTAGIQAVLNVTSDKCYENREGSPRYSEKDPVGGYDPYSSSKACAELVSTAYRQSYFNSAAAGRKTIGLATARAGNVIGGGDWAQDRLIPDFMRAIKSGEKNVRIRNPQATRPWQHVFEPLSGYLNLAQALYKQGSAFSEAWNFGPAPNDSRTVISIAEKVVRLWDDGLSYSVDTSTANLHETLHLSLDCSKARTRLDWQPRLSLDKALEMTVSWYRSYFAGKPDMRAESLAQIAEYEDLQGRYGLEKIGG